MTENTIVQATINEAGFFQGFTTLSEKEKNEKTGRQEFVFKRFLEYWVPTIATVAAGFPQPTKWAEQEVSDGTKDGESRTYAVPVYDDPQVQYLQDALTSAVIALAKNRDKSPDGEIPTSWEQILEGASAFTEIYKLFRDGLVEWAIAKGNTAEQAAKLRDSFDTRKLPTYSNDYKAALVRVLDKFEGDLEDSTAIAAALRRARMLLAKDEPNVSMLAGLSL